tara:strand:- start:604 stop:753 length:150 start_codon:yes stop_codon:yes gene_type:complete
MNHLIAFVSDACSWAMRNPAELLIAVMAVILMDIDESLDNIEEAQDVQA